MQYTLKEHEVLSEDLPLSYDKPEGACEPDLALFHDILSDICSLFTMKIIDQHICL